MDIFNLLLLNSEDPTSLKSTPIIPLLKKNMVTCLKEDLCNEELQEIGYGTNQLRS